MATLTTNLFHGTGESDHRLAVVEGHWPDDMDGWVFVVGPDNREPGGHWFSEHGLLCRIDCAPDADGRVRVQHRRIHTPLERLQTRFPKLFRTFQFLEVSPFGFTNMANTNVQAIDGRLFVGFDAGRPVEVDPATLDYVTAVGATSEWLQAAPATVEPLVSVAAHPAPAFDERALYFVNYSPMPPQRTSIARWGLNGPVERWPLEGMSTFDSIHDVKATRDHLVISDLPFVFEPQNLRGGERTRPNQDVTHLWIVDKAALRSTPPGRPVPVTEVEIPMPTGHLSVDYDHPAGEITVYLEHIPLADLTISLGTGSTAHRSGEPFALDYEGLIALGVQPGAVGKYRIDVATGDLLEAEVTWDDRFWGGILATRDESTEASRAHYTDLWYAGCGFDPDLVSEQWWQLYAEAGNTALVPPGDLPADARPGAVARFDLESMKVADVFQFGGGAFPSPPTFVPRRDADGPGDGYLLVIVHRDGQKELAVFDAHDLERGPLARATAPGFNPALLLHSCWMPERVGPRPSDYQVPVRRDIAGSITAWPSHARALRETSREIKRELSAAGTGH